MIRDNYKKSLNHAIFLIMELKNRNAQNFLKLEINAILE
jgi:hypothetical protein